MPAFAPILKGSNVDWQYRTVPMKNACRSKRGKTCAWARGKVIFSLIFIFIVSF